ncbi:hypothetical protein J3R82DRAFT_10811 [Butyriboletus roseoflavus]|nr:hypothetical protein J3R82DRAFT_10811 [Butyriboletus roseoflavus]
MPRNLLNVPPALLAESSDNTSSDPSQSRIHSEKPNEPTLPHTTPPARFPPSLSDPQPRSYPGPASQPAPLSWSAEQGSTLSQTSDASLPVPPPSERSPSRSSSFLSSSAEAAKRRPLPTPPLMLQHSPSSSELRRISVPIPSSPPPPYSMFLPTEDPVSMTRNLSTVVASASTTTLAPEAPVIMAPLPNEQGAHGLAPYDSFLCHTPPANTWIAVETSQSEYVLLVRLPGFRRDGMQVRFLSISDLSLIPSLRTIATRRRRILHVVADSWEPEGGHFERRVSFGYDAELAQVRAEFDGEMLRIVVPRRISAILSR